jgi:hypothetical protein
VGPVPEPPAVTGELMPPARHHYGVGVMRWSVRFVLEAATSLRAASRVLEVLRGWLPGVERAPAPNTGQYWLLRLGLYELQRPKEVASDWVLLVDHTVQLGAVKCLLIVAVRLSAWEARGRGPLEHRDLAVLALEPMRQSTGPQVQAHLEQATDQTGEPRAVLTDGGKDLKKALGGFREQHPGVAELSDIKHKMALLVKAELKADARWSSFVPAVGRTKFQLQQTDLACLMPPSPKEKSRYMNLGELVNWGRRVLRYLDTPAESRELVVAPGRLEAKLGWLREYREALTQWSGMLAVVDETLEVIRQDGYYREAASVLRDRLAGLGEDAMSRRVAERAVAFVAEQSLNAVGEEHLPGSTECLESLIGKGKRLEGQQSRSGFTKMVLGMAASVAEPTAEYLRTALETVKTADVIAWCKEKLELSIQSQRRRALPPLSLGTKTG